MKLHACSNCGVVIVFDTTYDKTGWVDPGRNWRVCKCPVCTYPIHEGEHIKDESSYETAETTDTHKY